MTPIPSGSMRTRSSNPPVRKVGRMMPTVPRQEPNAMVVVFAWEPCPSTLEWDDEKSSHSSLLLEHDLFPKTGIHFSGSCSMRRLQSQHRARVGGSGDDVAQDLDDPPRLLHQRCVARRELA